MKYETDGNTVVKDEEKLVYSLDDGDWAQSSEDIEELLNEHFTNDGGEIPEDMRIHLFAGTPTGFKASEFLPHIWDHIADNADNNVGEYSDDWIYSVSANQKYDLQKKIEEVVDKFFDDIDNQPTFYRIHNVKPVIAVLEDGSTEDEFKVKEVIYEI